MPNLQLGIQFTKNEGLVMSPSNLLDIYLPGMPLSYPDGTTVSEQAIAQKIKTAQKQIENFLSIKFGIQELKEEHDFNREEFRTWGYIRTIYPIRKVSKLEGTINGVTHITYPEEWISIKQTNEPLFWRNLHIVPNTRGSNTFTQHAMVFSGVSPSVGYFGANYIPNYWKVFYTTGFEPEELPDDLIDVIGKLASIQVLAITGDLVFGLGIGNQSISIDGISQTYSTTKGGGKGAFSGRIQQYKDELTDELVKLKAEYLGILFKVV